MELESFRGELLSAPCRRYSYCVVVVGDPALSGLVWKGDFFFLADHLATNALDFEDSIWVFWVFVSSTLGEFWTRPDV
eukprot:6749254-Pyramimonas_sp.AAC.1